MSTKLIPSLCPYCAVGCGLYLVVDKGKATGIEYMTEHPTSEGALCPKGNAVLEILNHEERLKYPMKKVGDGFVRISWEEALDMVAQGMTRNIRKHGPGTLGFLASSRCNNEENYLLEKMARLLGSPHVDNCARLCHSPTVVGLGAVFGTGAMTNNLADLENSKCIFAIGTNFTEAHPIVTRWVQKAKDNGAVVIVADPRITSTSWMADIHLRIKPGSDIDLLWGMMKVIVEAGLADWEFIGSRTVGVDELLHSLKDYTLEEAAGKTGVPAGDIIRAAKAYAISPASALLYSMGITQHVCGTDNVKSCATLALLCGHVGRPGAGVWPMRGQNNVQGNCDMGGMPEFYPGYKKSTDLETIEYFKKGWNVSNLPMGPGLTSTEMNDAALKGDLLFMYIIGEDPVVCDANVKKTRQALESLDFLVVQEIFMTPTARMADVVLPAAAWAEKDGSYTSMDRRVQWIDKAVDAPGEAKEGMWIICQIAKRMGLDFPYESAAQVLKEIVRLVPQYKGMTLERISRMGGLRWPCPDEKHPGTDILHTQRFSTPDGKARMATVKNRPPGEDVSPEYPILLTTGRIVLHYNGGSMTLRSESLNEREPELYVEINPMDALNLNVGQGAIVVVTTRRGMAEAKARITEKVKPGMVFMPFHYHGTNIITSDALDPVAKIPEYKIAACRIEAKV
ncbi:MAG: Formate dehydrogenase subunit alpha [Methanosaeta sp. PtaB.Bin018]|nr:MAG: Formate dehydrogenase subunit alpha [Methanosaeta sp. PtaB.Bin018]OPY47251.1 MAG: Formate dehydrogenase subunit alpha [Methanosaeta sp. PtaU1.Bin016]